MSYGDISARSTRYDLCPDHDGSERGQNRKGVEACNQYGNFLSVYKYSPFALRGQQPAVPIPRRRHVHFHGNRFRELFTRHGACLLRGLRGSNHERSEEDCELKGFGRVRKLSGQGLFRPDGDLSPVDLFRRVEGFYGSVVPIVLVLNWPAVLWSPSFRPTSVFWRDKQLMDLSLELHMIHHTCGLWCSRPVTSRIRLTREQVICEKTVLCIVYQG